MPRTQWIGGNLRLAMPEVPRIGRSQQRLRCGLRKGKREGFYQRTASALEFWMVELPIAAGAAAAAHRLGVREEREIWFLLQIFLNIAC